MPHVYLLPWNSSLLLGAQHFCMHNVVYRQILFQTPIYSILFTSWRNIVLINVWICDVVESDSWQFLFVWIVGTFPRYIWCYFIYKLRVKNKSLYFGPGFVLLIHKNNVPALLIQGLLSEIGKRIVKIRFNLPEYRRTKIWLVSLFDSI